MMKTGIYLCECGGNISDKINLQKVTEEIMLQQFVGYVERINLMCSFDGQQALISSLLNKRPDRVVIAACSPRDHEKTFMDALSQAGINPYLMQMVNFREQLAWVTEDGEKATQKAISMLKGALGRVRLQESLTKQKLSMATDVVIIGAGPAGLKAALTLAKADRKVTIVEKSPMVGGLPVQYGELFPEMECGPCMLEPLEHEIFHGDYAKNIEIMTSSELHEVKGFYGNFILQVKKHPRYVQVHKCIGCGECVNVCPISIKNPLNFGRNQKKAIDFTFFGALPNATYIDYSVCLRAKGENCTSCRDVCPIEGTVNYEDTEEIVNIKAGAVLLAVGSGLYDLNRLPNLGYGKMNDVISSLEFERMLASTGPTSGKIQLQDGGLPGSIAIIHCVGSLDKEHKSYCSGTCCQSAFKYNHEIHQKLHGAKIVHLYRQFVFPGKSNYNLYEKAMHNPDSILIKYKNIKDINVFDNHSSKIIQYKDCDGHSGEINVDMVILLPAVIPSSDSKSFLELLEVNPDKEGFFEELHGIADNASSKVKGVYLAGSCQSPKDIAQSMTQGMASAGYILSGLIPGRQLEIEPITATVIDEKCAGCRVCASVCPYKAVQFDEEKKKSTVNAVLCQGCGTCVASCPAGAIKGNNFTLEQIFAEIKGLMS
ncbi:MAG: CoB--CoM heterodisulfide reductase iron-sulfur subunit A family protein [Candidatus Margulisbacteria bacterium]|nr:CoB--CoM heterodisulfide reductase iron-sulfur subunit A family protein [Candidatus Margulisiibacteriota bacterium]